MYRIPSTIHQRRENNPFHRLVRVKTLFSPELNHLEIKRNSDEAIANWADACMEHYGLTVAFDVTDKGIPFAPKL